MENNNISKHQNIAAGQLIKEKEYWQSQITGDYQKGHFSFDMHQDNGSDTKNQKNFPFELETKSCERLLKITNGSNAKIHMAFTTAVAVLLNKFTGIDQLRIGTTIEKQETDQPLINTILPLNFSFNFQSTFKSLLMDARSTINNAIQHQNYPLETMDTEKEGLFDVAVILENIQDKKYLSGTPVNIIFSFNVQTDSLSGTIYYNANLYREESIQNIILHFNRLLEATLFQVDQPISEISLLSAWDQEQLARYNATQIDYPSDKTIIQLIEQQFRKNPENIAIVDDDRQNKITYSQMEIEIDGWAKWLSQQGLSSGDIVGIQVEPSIAQVCALLGILKNGAVYMPIDINYPEERKIYMLNDSSANLMIVQKDLEAASEWKGKTIFIEDYPGSDGIEDATLSSTDTDAFPRPTDPAYIIYTSGSTGQPKGVVVGHRSLVNYITWAAKMYVKGETVAFPLYTSLAFDLTVTSIYTPLVSGNTIYAYRGSDKEFLVERVFKENLVDVMKLTPVHLMLMANDTAQAENSKIKRFIVGGEKLDTQLALDIHNKFQGHIEIYNEYGPTEATVGCMIHRFNPQTDTGLTVPIGLPAQNTCIYLLDKHLKHVPFEAVGELYIAGDGLALEYLNRQQLTQQRFVQDPFVAGQKMYKSGDLARWLPEGIIEFLGRIDGQVKIKGYRIETGEIENCINKHPYVKQAVVCAKDDTQGFKYLAAYIVVDDQGIENDFSVWDLREYLTGSLPEFMIPSTFTQIKTIPTTINGKIDYKAFPEPDFGTFGKDVEYKAPSNHKERVLVQVWEEVFKVQQVSVLDNYFSLGGDSIKAIQLAARLSEHNYKVPIADFFTYPTIEELAKMMEETNDTQTIDQSPVEGNAPLTPIQHWFFKLPGQERHYFNQTVMLHRPQGFDKTILEEVFRKLVTHHDALRFVYKGEYDNPDSPLTQYNRGVEPPFYNIQYIAIDSGDYRKEIQDTSSRIQAEIDLQKGPLVKLALFTTHDGDFLMIAIHHLVMDGVSWRILFQDFVSLYSQIKQGKTEDQLELPQKTTSYKEWAQKLKEYADSNDLLHEIEYWEQLENQFPLTTGKHKGNPISKEKDSRTLTLELSQEHTQLLLKEVNHAYNTEINDILLTALGKALCDWTGKNSVAVTLEGHGREEIIPGTDLTRTVGWFTSEFPVILDMTNKNDIAVSIKDTKEMLRHIPNKGIGYGILRHLTSKENIDNIQWSINPEISFNYLGQIDQDIDTDLFQTSDISPGSSVSLQSERIYPIYIMGIVLAGKLSVSISYDPSNYEESELRTLVNSYETHLLNLIDHCTEKEDTEYTPSDYSVSISDKEADAAFDAISGIELDI